MDERSAAYTAVGMAVALNKPVAIICTSGTAVLNLYPAICEAYYSQIPLLVITADRPADLIDNWDGQCIRQTDIFERHILDSFTYDPLNPTLDINKAISLCIYPKKGPVHINVPLADPLYQAKNEEFVYEELAPITKPVNFAPNHLSGVFAYKKIMVFAGTDAFGGRLKDTFENLKKAFLDFANRIHRPDHKQDNPKDD